VQRSIRILFNLTRAVLLCFVIFFWLSCEDSLLLHLLACVIGGEYRERDMNDAVIVVRKRFCGGIHIFY
jgi:hypothetical protein